MTRLHLARRAAFVAATFVLCAQTLAADPLPDFDQRDTLPSLAPNAVQIQGLASLRREQPDVQLRWNARFGTPATVWRRGARLSDAPMSDPEAAARAWLRDHAAIFGWSAADVDLLHLAKVLSQPDHGPKLVLLHQVFGGLEGGSLGGSIAIGLDDFNRVLIVRADAVRESALAASPQLSAQQAVAKLVGVGIGAPVGERAGWLAFTGVQATGGVAQFARLAAFPQPQGGTRAVWEVLHVPTLAQGYRVAVDAATGVTLLRQEKVFDATGAGRVFRNYPGAPIGGSQELVSFGGDPLASPSGWLGLPGGVQSPTTFGNNANVATHWSVDMLTEMFNMGALPLPNPLGPIPPVAGELRPVVASGVFNTPFRNSWADSQCGGGALALGVDISRPSYAGDAMASVVNLFYLLNTAHDTWYRLGFDEAAGNYQLDNFGKGGQGEDEVIGMAQFAALAGGERGLRNDAYFNTGPDGVPGWTAIMLAEPGPYERLTCHDNDFDASVAYHEYAHGVTARWLGGEFFAIAGVQGGALNEANSDYAATQFMASAGIDSSTVAAAYAFDSRQRGARSWPLADVPVGFGDIGYGPRGVDAHSDMEIWSGTLWALRTAFEQRDGAHGATYFTQLFADAFPLSGPRPSLLDMRDTLLAADVARSGGANQDLMWTVFASRGFGASAQTAGPSDADPRPGYDHPASAHNGLLQIQAIDYAAGQPIAQARIIVGRFEGGVSAATFTGIDGRASMSMQAGAYHFVIQAPGYGAQPFVATVAAGASTSLTLRVPHNVASIASGASVVAEPDGATAPFSNALDDRSASAWSIASSQPQTMTIRLAGDQPVGVRRLRVAPMAPGDFMTMLESLAAFDLESSLDGVKFTPLLSGAFPTTPPWPSADELNYRTWFLPAKVSTRYLRLRAKAPQQPALNVMRLAELQVFTADAVTAPAPPPPVSLHDEGSVLITLALGTSPSQLLMGLNCSAPPLTQDLDAHVTAIPPALAAGNSTLRVTSPIDALGSVTGSNILVSFLDRNCQYLGGTQSQPNTGSVSLTIPAGARYAVSQPLGRVPPARVIVDGS